MTGRGGGSRGTGQTFPKHCSRPVRRACQPGQGQPPMASKTVLSACPSTPPAEEPRPALYGGWEGWEHPTLVCVVVLVHTVLLPTGALPCSPPQPAPPVAAITAPQAFPSSSAPHIHSIFPKLTSGCLGLSLKSPCCHPEPLAG